MQNKKISSKKLLWIVLGATLVAAVSGLFAYLRSGNDTGQSAHNLPAEQESNYVENEDQPLVTTPSPSESGSDEKIILPSDNSSDATNPPEKPSLTRADASNGTLRVSAIFSNSSSGTCVLQLEKAGLDTVEYSAPIIVGPSYYTCNGFRIQLSDLPAKGEWTVKVLHRHNNKTTESDERTITIE